jgi:hypothetical protein
MERASIFIFPATLFGFADAAREFSAQNTTAVAALPGVPNAHEPHQVIVGGVLAFLVGIWIGSSSVYLGDHLHRK